MTKLIIAALAFFALAACEDDLAKLKSMNDPNAVASPKPSPSLSPLPLASPTPDPSDAPEDDLGKLPAKN